MVVNDVMLQYSNFFAFSTTDGLLVEELKSNMITYKERDMMRELFDDHKDLFWHLYTAVDVIDREDNEISQRCEANYDQDQFSHGYEYYQDWLKRYLRWRGNHYPRLHDMIHQLSEDKAATTPDFIPELLNIYERTDAGTLYMMTHIKGQKKEFEV